MTNIYFQEEEQHLSSPEADAPLEGEMSLPPAYDTSNKEFSTLNEPVKDTIMRDVKAVGLKFFHVLYPKQKKTLLKDWDLWGPLFLCVFLATMLHDAEEDSTGHTDNGLQFAEIFFIVWAGSVIVTLNSKLLGGTISFFQSVCVLGYCLLAPSVALIICRIITLTFNNTLGLFILRFVFTMLGFLWATFASVTFLGESQPPRRTGLAVYPIFLFYFVISWMILSHS